MRIFKPCLLILLFGVFFLFTAEAQRFSLVTEVGGMKTQVDGDKIQGFHYNGVVFGLGSVYTINESNFLAVKTSYYRQGSRRKDQFQDRPREGFQLQLDFQTIALELSYKHKLPGGKSFLGAGFLRHQLVNLDYELVSVVQKGADDLELTAEELNSAYLSVKGFAGRQIFPRTELYLAMESAISNMLTTDFSVIRTLAPYSLSAVLTYEIIAPKFEQRKKPGYKKRS
ncbi:hypothetical protein [Portibacter marinus]|uniref:hypothetical protein n=1 Tax=Portibacter marinus TaxID=2898660 RepID=UPI001F3FA422|nr:hypothetical protein [Portibacter marinus]